MLDRYLATSPVPPWAKIVEEKNILCLDVDIRGIAFLHVRRKLVHNETRRRDFEFT
jgi:hypothetical protein